MRARVTIGEFPFKGNYGDKPLPALKPFQETFLKMFKAYGPKPPAKASGTYGYPTYDFEVPTDDAQVEKLLEELGAAAKKNKPQVAVVLWETPGGKEVARARFLEPYYMADYVDGGPLREPLNPGMRLCEKCNRPNLKRLPEPFLVSKDVRKKYDVFHTSVSIVIVRPKLLELLHQAVGDQIQFGEARIAGEKSAAKGDDRLYWVRPKQSIGQRQRVIKDTKPCPECGRKIIASARTLDNLVKENGVGLLDCRTHVEHFGKGQLDIALVPEPEAGWLWPEIVMSGALLAFLKTNGVKGIAALGGQLDPQCLFSAKREATLEAEARTFGPASAAAKKKPVGGKPPKKPASVAAMKNVPWDCQADGYVYFELSTPEFVVMDPMTGEEDSEGAYTVKNFQGAGLYRLAVSAIKRAKAEGSGVAVDSASLVFVDNEYLAAFVEAYDWDRATKKNGDIDWKYHEKIAEKVGTRFGVCSPPPKKFKSQFVGDGFYRIDVKGIEKALAT